MTEKEEENCFESVLQNIKILWTGKNWGGGGRKILFWEFQNQVQYTSRVKQSSFQKLGWLIKGKQFLFWPKDLNVLHDDDIFWHIILWWHKTNVHMIQKIARTLLRWKRLKLEPNQLSIISCDHT